MKPNLAAYTILEVMVVFAVIAVLAGIGITAMVSFRSLVQLQEASSGFVSTLRTVQNMARTGALVEDNPSRYINAANCTSIINAEARSACSRRADAFAVYFDSDDNYSIRACTINGNGYACSYMYQDQAKPREFADIVIRPTATSQDSCRVIVFERLTGAIYSMGNLNDTSKQVSGECVLEIRLNEFDKREVFINLTTSSIRI